MIHWTLVVVIAILFYFLGRAREIIGGIHRNIMKEIEADRERENANLKIPEGKDAFNIEIGKIKRKTSDKNRYFGSPN